MSRRLSLDLTSFSREGRRALVGFLAAIALSVAHNTLADPLTDRIAQSAEAAQGLQGPLDGAWTLRDHAGAILFVFQMSDPPGSVGPVEGAWRDQTGAIGTAEFVADHPHRLRVVVDGAAPVIFVLMEHRGGEWRGALPGRDVVTLTRGLATPPPPV